MVQALDLKTELPEHAELAETIYRRLGPPTVIKALQVERLRLGLGVEVFENMGDTWPTWRAVKKEFDELLRERLKHDEGKIAKWTERLLDHGLCHHAFFRHIDNTIAHIGKGSRVRLPGSGDEGRRVRGAGAGPLLAVLGARGRARARRGEAGKQDLLTPALAKKSAPPAKDVRGRPEAAPDPFPPGEGRQRYDARGPAGALSPDGPSR